MAQDELIVVVDTCVLMKAGLTEFLVKVHAAGGCRLRWSEEIQEELDRKIGRRPSQAQARIQMAMRQVRDALVPVSDLDRLATNGLVHDPDDAIVAAAALGAVRMVSNDPARWKGAEVVLVTENVADFDEQGLDAEGVLLLGCDDLGYLLLERNEALVVTSVDPSRRPGTLLQKLRRDGLVETADRIEARLRQHGLL